MFCAMSRREAIIEADVASLYAPLSSLYVLVVSSIVGRHLIFPLFLPQPPAVSSVAVSESHWQLIVTFSSMDMAALCT
jgi:hypothetical protein